MRTFLLLFATAIGISAQDYVCNQIITSPPTTSATTCRFPSGENPEGPETKKETARIRAMMHTGSRASVVSPHFETKLTRQLPKISSLPKSSR